MGFHHDAAIWHSVVGSVPLQLSDLPFPSPGKSSMRGHRISSSPEVALNQQVKNLIQKLGEAIHESVSESESIADVVREIREQGFDVLLMLEATIGLNRVEDEDAESAKPTEETVEGPFTRHDLSFLRSLRITTEEHGEGEDEPPSPS